METITLGAAAFSLSSEVLGKSSEDKGYKEMLVYVGTYTSGKSRSEGIYIYKLNMDSGTLSPYQIVKGVVEPSYLTIDASRKYLFAVNETETYEGKKSGAVSSFAVNQKTADLTFLNKQASLGGAPCYVTTTNDGKFVLVANYLGGNAAVFPVNADGKLGNAVELIQNSGTGPNKGRQESAHAHSINLDSAGKFAYLCDLGADKIFIYKFDSQQGKLIPNSKQPFFSAKPGAGPRHFTFHSRGKMAFVINELDSTITTFAVEHHNGTLQAMQTLSTLPEDFQGANTCADIHVSPDGKYLYGSNRGHDSIVVFKINEKDGTLKFIEHVSSGGKTPRNFVVDPTGKFLLAANQNSDSVVVFRIDKTTGRLSVLGNPVSVPTPVCLKFVAPFA